MTWFCEYPDHVGSRNVQSPMDRFTRRVTYVRGDGKQRLHEKSVPGGRICRSCISIAEGKANPDQGSIL